MKYDIAPPNLFPLARDYPDPRELRRYISDRLVEMVKDDTFCLTHILLQSRMVSQIAADVIYGTGTEPDNRNSIASGTHHGGWPVPVELRTHTVEIESIDADCEPTESPIKYVDGEIELPVGVKRGGGFSRNETKVQRNIISADTPGEFLLREALLIIMQSGYGVKPAVNGKLQARWWTTREVNPALPWATLPATTGDREADEARY